jgi:hypothetical protein
LPEASHWVHHDEPERVTQLLNRLLRRRPTNPKPPNVDDLGPARWPPGSSSRQYVLTAVIARFPAWPKQEEARAATGVADGDLESVAGLDMKVPGLGAHAGAPVTPPLVSTNAGATIARGTARTRPTRAFFSSSRIRLCLPYSAIHAGASPETAPGFPPGP